jgi:hypothetical protein
MSYQNLSHVSLKPNLCVNKLKFKLIKLFKTHA